MQVLRKAMPTCVLLACWVLAACGSSEPTKPAPIIPVVPVTPVMPPPPVTVTLAPGASASVASGGTLSLVGGATGGEYVLVVADTATNGSSTAISYQLTALGITGAGGVSAPSTNLVPLPPEAASVGVPRLDYTFSANLNARASSLLTPRFAAARRVLTNASAGGGATFSVSAAPPAVGDLMTLNVSSRACDSLMPRGGRVVAIGAQSIVVADTLNPVGGFSAADYQRFATRFDTLVYPLDVANFGAPAVFGVSGKIVLFFTTAVNALTPKSSTSFVGGFFFGRDLFPAFKTPDLQACEGSNESNLFYLLTPDPAGTVNGNIRRTGFVDSVTTSVLAHEFQHLINASRRLYVNKGATGFETVWLNEGLSHEAEELLFYHEGGSGPLQNLDVTAIKASQKLKDSFNANQGGNAGRYRSYLQAPSTSSPIRNDDSLSTRGATWDFLRYAADRKTRNGGTDVSVWQALANSTTSGIANLRQVFGSNIGAMLSDWSVAQYADDVVPGASADFSQPSWNWHTIYPALGGSPASPSTYPLLVTGLTTTGAGGTVIPGASAFYRFSVAANATATVGITAGSSAAASPVQGVVVRLR